MGRERNGLVLFGGVNWFMSWCFIGLGVRFDGACVGLAVVLVLVLGMQSRGMGCDGTRQIIAYTKYREYNE